MITAKVSITKKRPAAQQYSSDSYTATLEIELPEAMYLDGNGDLRKSLAKLFKEVEGQVNEQIGNGAEKPLQKLQELRSGDNGTEGSCPSPRRAPAERQAPSRSSGGNGRRPSGNGRHAEDSNSYEPVPATQKQIGYLLSLCKREHGMAPSDIVAMVRRSTDKLKVWDLNRAEASRLIEDLKRSA